MDDSARYRLLYGPYSAPACKRGDVLVCEARGEEVKVGGLTDAPIPWPRVLKNGRPSLIVCGDLARAVRFESEIAIAHHWGVGVVTVWAWRKALGVGRITDGTARLYREYQPEKITETAYVKMTATTRTEEFRCRMSDLKRGRKMHPSTRKALLKAVRRPKSREHRRKIALGNWEHWQRMPRPRKPVLAEHKGWTAAEERLLGKTTDRDVARLLGRTLVAVRARRRRLGIPESRHSKLRRIKKGHL